MNSNCNLKAADIDHEKSFENAPEKALIEAIVFRSLSDLKNHDRVTRANARNYIFSNCDEPWTFRWCLQHMNLDHHVLTIQLKSTELIAKVEQRDKDELLPRGRKLKYYGPGTTHANLFALP